MLEHDEYYYIITAISRNECISNAYYLLKRKYSFSKSMRAREKKSNSSHIRSIHFRKSARKVIELLSQNFDETFLIEGVSFKRNRKLVKKLTLLWLLDVFHPVLKRFGEVFIWEKNHEIIGTGTIMRADIRSNKTWVLINFALSQSQVFGFLQALGMRCLLRMAIYHATQNGASKIQAYIRSDNYPTLRLCIAEGFQEVEEKSYWVFEIDHLAQLDKSEFKIVRDKIIIYFLPIQLLRSYLSGVKKNLFYVYKNNILLGNIEMTTHSVKNKPFRLSVNFINNLSTEDIKSIVTLALSMLLKNAITNRLVILSLPSNTDSDVWLSDKFNLLTPKVKRKLLTFTVKKDDACP